MFKQVPEKFIKASNLIFFVTLLKIVNIIILDHIPTQRIPWIMYPIIALFIICGFVIRRGTKWLVYFMPLVMLLPWVILQTNIFHVFKLNPLAGIFTGAQFFLQVIIMEILLVSKSKGENSRPTRVVRV